MISMPSGGGELRKTHMSETTRRKTGKADSVLAGAVDIARKGLAPIAKPEEIGEHLGATSEGERLVTHSFECLKPGYRGWHWVAVLARVPRGRKATVCEIDLLPGEDALLARPWVPWAERLRPQDIKREDVLPYVPDDERLDQSYADTNAEDLDQRTLEELGLGRPRVLSACGRAQAAKRWYHSEQGPARRGMTRKKLPENTCSTCGFLLKVAGSMRTMFGVCTNEWSVDDGRVVSMDHTCGSHSETDVKVDTSPWQPTPARLNELDVEQVEI